MTAGSSAAADLGMGGEFTLPTADQISRMSESETAAALDAIGKRYSQSSATDLSARLSNPDWSKGLTDGAPGVKRDINQHVEHSSETELDASIAGTFVPPIWDATDEAGMTARDRDTEIKWLQAAGYSEAAIRQWRADKPVDAPEYYDAQQFKRELNTPGSEWNRRWRDGDPAVTDRLQTANMILILGLKKGIV